MSSIPSKILMAVIVGLGGPAQISAAASEPRAKAPVLVELFTSEGCSSCPPADEALARLDERQPVAGAEVIGLEWHVDYWNRLGWSDPYSSAEFTARQESYATAFRLDGVYTPQAVVDGRTQLVGSSADLVTAISASARRAKAKVQLSVGQPSADSVEIRVGVSELPAFAQGEAELWLAITESNLQTQVPRGENAGRRLKHAAVVRRSHRVGRLSAGAKELPVIASRESLDPTWVRANLRATAFLQERGSRRVLGAASIALDLH